MALLCVFVPVVRSASPVPSVVREGSSLVPILRPPVVLCCIIKKERKQTTQGRDGRTARRHHTGILRRGVWCASRRPPLGVCLFLSLFAVPLRFSLQPSCHLAVFPLSSFYLSQLTAHSSEKNSNKTTLSHSTQARHRCELARASTITGTPPEPPKRLR